MIGPFVAKTMIRNAFVPPALSMRENLVASGSACGTPMIFDLETEEPIRRLKVSGSEEVDVCRQVSWHPRHPLLAATSFSGKVHLFEYNSSIRQKPRGRAIRIDLEQEEEEVKEDLRMCLKSTRTCKGEGPCKHKEKRRISIEDYAYGDL